MMNSAPSVPYVIDVPDSAENSELSPAVKSTVMVFPRALSLGQALRRLVCWKGRVEDGWNWLTGVCQRITIGRCLPLDELGEGNGRDGERK